MKAAPPCPLGSPPLGQSWDSLSLTTPLKGTKWPTKQRQPLDVECQLHAGDIPRFYIILFDSHHHVQGRSFLLTHYYR